MIEALRKTILEQIGLAGANEFEVPGRILAAIKNDPVLTHELLYYGAERAAAEFLRNMRNAANPAQTKTTTDLLEREPNNDDPEGLIAVARWTLFERWTLVGGKRLGDATHDDLIASAAWREKQSAGLMRNARFERTVAAAVLERGGETVGAVLQRAEVEAIMVDIVGAVDAAA